MPRRLHDQLSLMKGHMPLRYDRKKAHDRHEAKTADLDQKQKHDLPKHTPMRICVIDDKSRYTGGAGRRKKRIQKRRPGMITRRDRQGKQYGTDQDHHQKADGDPPCIAKPIFDFLKFQRIASATKGKILPIL